MHTLRRPPRISGKEPGLNKTMRSFPHVALCVTIATLFAGCASSEKCDTSSGCCDSTSECCEADGAKKEAGCCKDGTMAEAAQSAAPVNKVCPIGEHDADPKVTAAYQGKTIAFCCDDCKQEFLAKDDAGKAAILAKATGN